MSEHPPILRPSSVRAEAAALADRLAEFGVGAGDRVLLLADNSPRYPVALFALCHLDTSVVVADAQLPERRLSAMARLAGVRWAVLGDGGATAPLARGDVFDLRHWRPTGRHLDGGDVALDRWRRRRDAVIMWSSGTGGVPKAVVKSGASVVENSRVTAETMAYRTDDVLAPLLPFSHQYGMSLLFVWWLSGCGLLVAPYRRIETALNTVASARATVVDSAPPTYHAMLSLLARRRTLLEGLRSVRLWCVGGAPLPAPLAREFQAMTGHELLDGYGMTESGNIAVALPGDAGCGRSLPGVDVQVLGPDGAGVPPGSLGEIAVRGAGCMEGYLREDGTYVPHTDEWLRTGDRGRLDSDGRLHVMGRMHAVNRGGHTIYPEEVERRAEECGAPVTVVALDHDRRGAVLVFFVRDTSLTEREWRRRFQDLLAPHERPNAVVTLNRFPGNPNGKVDVAGLRARAERLLARREHVEDSGGEYARG